MARKSQIRCCRLAEYVIIEIVIEKLGWFTLAYACISITVTIILLVVANKTFRLGGPVGMARGIGLLILAVVGFIVWAAKSAAGKADGSPNDQIKRTIRKTSNWLDSLKDEWDSGKSKSDRELPDPRDRRK